MNRRPVVLYIGTSLDGYIATKEDSLDWLLSTEGEGDNGFGEFYDTVDTIIMGKRTYDWIMEQEHGIFPYKGKKCYVYTKKPQAPTEYVTFTSETPDSLIDRMRKEDGKKIWIVGGEQIIHLFHKEHLIDEYVISIAPYILGDGIKLFSGGVSESLVMERTRNFGQFVEISYKKISD